MRGANHSCPRASGRAAKSAVYCVSVSRGGYTSDQGPSLSFRCHGHATRPRRDHRTHGISLVPRLRARKKTMSALVLTAFCFVPFLLLALAFIRSTALTKVLDDPHQKRRQ